MFTTNKLFMILVFVIAILLVVVFLMRRKNKFSRSSNTMWYAVLGIVAVLFILPVVIGDNALTDHAKVILTPTELVDIQKMRPGADNATF